MGIPWKFIFPLDRGKTQAQTKLTTRENILCAKMPWNWRGLAAMRICGSGPDFNRSRAGLPFLWITPHWFSRPARTKGKKEGVTPDGENIRSVSTTQILHTVSVLEYYSACQPPLRLSKWLSLHLPKRKQVQEIPFSLFPSKSRLGPGSSVEYNFTQSWLLFEKGERHQSENPSFNCIDIFF